MNVDLRTEKPPLSPILDLLIPRIREMCLDPVDIEVSPSGNSIDILPKRSDYGVLCGQRGRTINALKVLAAAAACEIRLIDSADSSIPSRAKYQFKRNARFNNDNAAKIAGDMHAIVASGPATVTHSTNGEGELIITIDTSVDGEGFLVQAINEVMYPWGRSQGMIIRVRPADHRRT